MAAIPFQCAIGHNLNPVPVEPHCIEFLGIGNPQLRAAADEIHFRLDCSLTSETLRMGL